MFHITDNARLFASSNDTEEISLLNLKKNPQQSETLKFQGKECIYKMIEIVNSGTH